jgi:hypothetical protein
MGLLDLAADGAHRAVAGAQGAAAALVVDLILQQALQTPAGQRFSLIWAFILVPE